MDLATIEPALVTLFATLSGLDTYWEDQPRDALVNPDNAAICLLHLGPPVGLGRDERIQVLVDNPDPGGELQDLWHGDRQVVLTVKIESYDQTSGKTALARLEQIRNKLPRRSTRAALEAVKVALVKAGTVLDLPDTRDDRKVSIGVLDITLANRTTDLDPDPYPFIEFVNFGATDFIP